MTTTFLRPRALALAMYFLYLFGGIVFMFAPSAIMTTVPLPYTITWHVFLILGSVIAIAGTVTKRPAVEATGLPLLGAALVAYGVLMIWYANTAHASARLGFGLLMLGTAVGLTGRVIELRNVIRIAIEIEEIGEDVEGRDG